MSFHITVKDNDNGKVLVDLDALCIIGGLNVVERGVAEMCFTSGNMIPDGKAVTAAFIAAEFVLRKLHPTVGEVVLKAVKECTEQTIKDMEGAIV